MPFFAPVLAAVDDRRASALVRGGGDPAGQIALYEGRHLVQPWPVKGVGRGVEWPGVAELVRADRTKTPEGKPGPRSHAESSSAPLRTPRYSFRMDVPGGKRTASGSGAALAPVVRCILWHAPGSILPGALIGALDRPTIQWKAWDCDFLTLAELCRPDLALDPLTRSARAKVVLLVEPSRLSGLAQVLDAIERFRSSTPIWVFQGGATPRLVGMSVADVRREYVTAKAMTPPSDAPVPRPPAKPALRVVTRAVGVIVPKPIAPPGGDEAASRRGSPRSPSEVPSPPSLRLAGSEEPSRPPEDASRSGPAGDQSEDPGQIPEQPRDTLLSEAEIEMLLSDPPPPRNGSSKRGNHVR